MILRGLLVLFLSSSAFSKTIVISDIDDTIKVSHVLDSDSALGNAFKTQNLFMGMPDLYRAIQKTNPDTSFYYISNAPASFMKLSHSRFLERHDFPKGTLLLRNDLGEKEHKVKSIRRIITNDKPDFIIYIGDNGERDVQVYNQMVEEFPMTVSITFIRQAYSSQNEEEGDRGQLLLDYQHGFVTPLEIALELSRIERLTATQVNELEASYVPAALKNANGEDRDGETGTLAFPNWVDCRDFKIPSALLNRQTPNSNGIVTRIAKRCSIPPFEN